MNNLEKSVTAFIVSIVVALALIATVFIVKWLWNWLMPTIFGLPTITVWQTLGLMFLSGFLFGGISGFISYNHRLKK